MKRFSNLRAEHVVGLSWWFWTRESFALLNAILLDVFSDIGSNLRLGIELRTLTSILILAVIVPCMYLLVPTYGAYMRKKQFEHSIKMNDEVVVLNKKNVKYFTVLDMLSGGQ